MTVSLHELAVRSEQDIVVVRQHSRQLAALLRFGTQDQTRIATAVSEVTRAAFSRSRRIKVRFAVASGETTPALEMTISSEEEKALPGIDGDALFAAACRLVDWCNDGATVNGKAVIVLSKRLPADAPTDAAGLRNIASTLARQASSDSLQEVQRQNQELVQALAELKVRQEELSALTRELEDTNRGVVALYAEIEEKAERLRHADEMKSRFLSNTSHELRTPLSSILALSQLLLNRVDGDLTQEQEMQVALIKNAASDLSGLVNDLLDLAKIEAGKVDVVRTAFSVEDLFGALRGMMKPLAASGAVELLFIDPPVPLTMHNDEGKISQILRNLIFNALKFTEEGEVRVSAHIDSGHVRFDVADTGIGISPEHLPLIFEEFGQVENRLQKHGKGTGLGLPLCRKLASLLGGDVVVESEPGRGSTFSLLLPPSARDRMAHAARTG